MILPGVLIFLLVVSLHNDGCYSITENGATAGELVLNEAPFSDENSDEIILIQKVQFPPDISMAAAEYIASKLNKHRLSKSISIGDYSESMLSLMEIMQVFRPWREVYAGL